MAQSELTADTVDAQFCSDWLKQQITRVFTQLAEVTEERDYYLTKQAEWDCLEEMHDKMESYKVALQQAVQFCRWLAYDSKKYRGTEAGCAAARLVYDLLGALTGKEPK